VLRSLAAITLAIAATGCQQTMYQAHPCDRPDLTGCVVESVKVAGNRGVPASDITSKIATAETNHNTLAGLFEDVPILSVWDRISVTYEKLDPFVLQRDLDRVERVYRARGYYDAHARAARLIKKRGDRVVVEIAVDEGEPVTIAEVKPVFLGTPPPPKIVDLVEGILREEPKGKPFDEDKFEATKKRLRRVLNDASYAYARVQSHAEVDPATHRATLVYTIDAGPACTFGDVDIEGHGSLPKNKLLQAIHIRKGTPYSVDRLEAAQGALSDLRVLGSVEAVPQLSYAPGGEAVAGALSAMAPPTGLAALAAQGDMVDKRESVVPVVFRVTPTTLGAGKVGFGAELGSKVEVHAVGTWEHRNALGGLRHVTIELKPGVVINPVTFATLFSSPATSLKPLPEVRFHAELEQPGFLEERTRGRVNLAVNLYQLQPLETLGYLELAGKAGIDRNFWGKRVNAALYLNMAFDQPMLLNPMTTIDTAKGFHRLVLPNVQTLGVLDYRMGADGKPDPLNPHYGAYLVNDVQLGLDDSLEAHSGAIGFDVRIRPEVRGFVPISKRTTLALKLAGGILLPFGGTLAGTPTPACPFDPNVWCAPSVPAGASTVDRALYIQLLQLRGFTSGGPSSNRGYAYTGVGPQERLPHVSPQTSTGQLVPLATGGAVMWEASAELRFPLYEKIGATIFLDGSDVRWHLSELGAPFAPHLSTGLGLRYLTPVGPFRADFGVRIPGAQVSGKGTCPAYDPNGSPAASTCYLTPLYGQAGPTFTLPLAIALAIGEAY
jgi:outer membrane protein insertion porin family/translocation and assembly module TamA